MHRKIRFDTNTLTLLIKLSKPIHTHICIDLFVCNVFFFSRSLGSFVVFSASSSRIRFGMNKEPKQKESKCSPECTVSIQRNVRSTFFAVSIWILLLSIFVLLQQISIAILDCFLFSLQAWWVFATVHTGQFNGNGSETHAKRLKRTFIVEL